MTITTTNMNLILPDVSITVGPTWASLLNAAQTTIDSHDHSSGKGVRITPTGMNISSDLTFAQNNATNLRTVRNYNYTSFTPTVNDRTCFYSLNGELYYIDAAGNNVQITANGTVNLSASVSALTLNDSSFFLQYFGDVTKKMRFDASAITSGQTRIYTMPDSNQTLVGRSTSDTLTNKTLDSTSVATGIRMASFTANGSNTLTAPTTSDTLVGRATTDTLTNKTLTSPAITGASTYTNTTVPATPSAGNSAIYVNSADGSLHLVSSSGTDTAIGSSGSSGKNYLQTYNTMDVDPSSGMTTTLTVAGNRTSSTTVWGASAGSLLTQNTGSQLRGTNSAQLVNASSASNFIESPLFVLDGIDVNTNQLFISFDMNSTGSAVASGDWNLKVIRYNSSGTYQEAITPSITAVPNGYYNFKCAFSHSATATDQYAIRFSSATATARTLYVDSLIVGPQQIVDANATGPWTTFVPSLSAGFGTVTNSIGLYRRVGDSMELQVTFTAGTVAATSATMVLPISLNIDASKLSRVTTSSQSSPVYGSGVAAITSGGVRSFPVLVSATTNTTLLYFGSSDASSNDHTIPATADFLTASSVLTTFSARIPISQWTTTVTLAQSPNIEYAYNTSTSDADDTTSFGYGALGISGVVNTTTLTATRNKRVRFQTPVQSTDRVVIEISANRTKWNQLTSIDTSSLISPIAAQNTNFYGMGIKSTAINSTDCDITFGRYAATSGATYGSAGSDWSGLSLAYWRVAKYSGVGLAELAPATAISQGSISRECRWTPYTPTLGAGFGTATSLTGFYKVLGDTLYVRMHFITGTVSASSGTIGLPSGFTINSSADFGSVVGNVGAIVGTYGANQAASYGAVIMASGTSTTAVYLGASTGGTSGPTSQVAGNAILNNAIHCSLQFEVPIV